MIEIGTTWRHKKRGTSYEVLHNTARLECASEPEFERMFEDDNWIVYRNLNTGSIHIRVEPEFADGRFVQIAVLAE